SPPAQNWPLRVTIFLHRVAFSIAGRKEEREPCQQKMSKGGRNARLFSAQWLQRKHFCVNDCRQERHLYARGCPVPIGARTVAFHEVQSRQNSRIAFVAACVCSKSGIWPAFGISTILTSSLSVSNARNSCA